ncbi:hypothetical protein V8C86DRAFT_2533174 [Haematococcus lacustris]
MQPALYHRYNVDEHEEEEEEEEEEGEEHQAFKAAYDAQMGNMADAVSNMDLSHANPWHGHQPVADNVEHEGDGEDSAGHVEAQGSSEGGTSHQGLEDDEVLLATSDDDEAPPNQGSPLLPDQPQLYETDAQGPAPPLSPRSSVPDTPVDASPSTSAAADLQGSQLFGDTAADEGSPPDNGTSATATATAPEDNPPQTAATAGMAAGDSSPPHETVQEAAELSKQNPS